MSSFDKRLIAKKSEDFDRWYTDVILQAELADYSPVKGCMVIRPYGYAIWENVQKIFDAMTKTGGVENAYFPLFIPLSFLLKEKDHVEGFSPQLAIVTHGGGEKLAEPLVVRPTSETIMYSMYSKWISSWRDLPLLINQWNNVVRWEKRTFLFLRTTEFLWQEGHTVHETEKDAVDFTLRALEWYRRLYEDYFGIYTIVGIKSESEKFAGGVKTYAIELLMPDGLALQAATSHYLGQNFSKVFGISFQNREGKNDFGHQTSWGLSTRSIGGLIMSHGDDQGLVLPPRLAPIQVVIVPVKNEEKILKYCEKLKDDLDKQEIRAKVDVRETKSMGWKLNEWELKGVPVRVVVGQKEMENGQLSVLRRDTMEKILMPVSSIKEISNLLEKIQKNLFETRRKFVLDHIKKVDDYEVFKETMKKEKGLLYAFWCEKSSCELKIKEETKASTRVLPLEAKVEKGKCIYCGAPAFHRWYFAQAY
jgi:prolyl-tRNA synthetase